MFMYLSLSEDYLPKDNGNASLQYEVFHHVWDEVDTEIQVKTKLNVCVCVCVCV